MSAPPQEPSEDGALERYEELIEHLGAHGVLSLLDILGAGDGAERAARREALRRLGYDPEGEEESPEDELAEEASPEALELKTLEQSSAAQEAALLDHLLLLGVDPDGLVGPDSALMAEITAAGGPAIGTPVPAPAADPAALASLPPELQAIAMEADLADALLEQGIDPDELEKAAAEAQPPQEELAAVQAAAAPPPPPPDAPEELAEQATQAEADLADQCLELGLDPDECDALLEQVRLENEGDLAAGFPAG